MYCTAIGVGGMMEELPSCAPVPALHQQQSSSNDQDSWNDLYFLGALYLAHRLLDNLPHCEIRYTDESSEANSLCNVDLVLQLAGFRQTTMVDSEGIGLAGPHASAFTSVAFLDLPWEVRSLRGAKQLVSF